MVDDRIAELEAKVDKLISWAKKEEKYTKEILEYSEELEVRIIQLESKPKNNSKANLWSDEEKNYLASRLTGLKTPRPILISLAEKWEEKFGKPRSYDSLRKMWSRIKT